MIIPLPTSNMNVPRVRVRVDDQSQERDMLLAPVLSTIMLLYWTLAPIFSTPTLAAVAVAAVVRLAMPAVAPPLVTILRLQCRIVVAQSPPWDMDQLSEPRQQQSTFLAPTWLKLHTMVRLRPGIHISRQLRPLGMLWHRVHRTGMQGQVLVFLHHLRDSTWEPQTITDTAPVAPELTALQDLASDTEHRSQV